MKPKVLILDEGRHIFCSLKSPFKATASLDTVSEQLIQQSLRKCSSDKTVIIIAHRLSTVESADKIFVLDKGQVAQVNLVQFPTSTQNLGWNAQRIGATRRSLQKACPATGLRRNVKRFRGSNLTGLLLLLHTSSASITPYIFVKYCHFCFKKLAS